MLEKYKKWCGPSIHDGGPIPEFAPARDPMTNALEAASGADPTDPADPARGARRGANLGLERASDERD